MALEFICSHRIVHEGQEIVMPRTQVYYYFERLKDGGMEVRFFYNGNNNVCQNQIPINIRKAPLGARRMGIVHYCIAAGMVFIGKPKFYDYKGNDLNIWYF